MIFGFPFLVLLRNQPTIENKHSKKIFLIETFFVAFQCFCTLPYLENTPKNILYLLDIFRGSHWVVKKVDQKLSACSIWSTLPYSLGFFFFTHYSCSHTQNHDLVVFCFCSIILFTYILRCIHHTNIFRNDFYYNLLHK